MPELEAKEILNGDHGGGPVRSAFFGNPVDPARWWRVRRFALSVVREYLGILQVYAGFPIPATQSP